MESDVDSLLKIEKTLGCLVAVGALCESLVNVIFAEALHT
jgi:hypothetical protein